MIFKSSTTATLRSNLDEVAKALRSELQERLAKAGVAVDEARLTHLAYAPEIAQVMLGDTSRKGILCTFAESRRNVLNNLVGRRQRILS